MKCLFILIGCALAILPAGCSRPGSELVGAWSSHDTFSFGDQRCEFFKNGTCFLELQGERISGDWSALDDGRLKVGVPLKGGPGLVLFADVVGDELFLEESLNRRTAYVRDGSAKAAEIRAAVGRAVSDREIRVEAERRAEVERLVSTAGRGASPRRRPGQ